VQAVLLALFAVLLLVAWMLMDMVLRWYFLLVAHSKNTVTGCRMLRPPRLN